MADSIFKLLAVAPFATAILVPGYIWWSFHYRIAPRGKSGNLERACLFLVFSSVSLALAIWIYGFPLVGDVDQVVKQSVRLMFLAMGISILCGIGTGLADRKDVVAIMLEKVGISGCRSTPTPWDLAFRREHGGLVRLTFRDGKNRWGWYGKASGASLGADGYDVYFQEAWYAKDGRIEIEPGSQGMWLSADLLECVRFYDYKELYEKQKFEPDQVGKDVYSSVEHKAYFDISRESGVGDRGGVCGRTEVKIIEHTETGAAEADKAST